MNCLTVLATGLKPAEDLSMYLHEEDFVLSGRCDELFDLADIHGKGFLTQDIPPRIQEQQTHLQVLSVEDTQVYNICRGLYICTDIYTNIHKLKET